MKKTNTVIVATGSYLPKKIIKNEDFLKNKFYNSDGTLISKDTNEIIQKFEEITGIKERRYVEDNLKVSDICYFAALDALESSGIDKESLDYIICAHNFGDVDDKNKRTDIVPTIAARVKFKLQILNPYTISFDLPFGCPGWIQGIILAENIIKAGNAKRIMVIGGETLSKISDPYDRDSMIYSDGAGAVILEAQKNKETKGILSYDVRSDTINHANLLHMGPSYNPEYKGNDLFLKMEGHKLYKYALETVPKLVKKSIDKANIKINDVKKILIHQANLKMDIEILKRIFDLYEIKEKIESLIDKYLPMTISWLGNSSVATIPTLLDLILKDRIDNFKINESEVVVFASVGAGMNVNSVVYKF